MQKKIRFYNKLYFRFFCIFGITSSVLVLLVGVVFFRLYSRNTIHEFREQLEIDAGEIADKVEEYSESGEENGYSDYMDATQALLESQNVDVWIMPYYKSINHLRSAYTNSNLKYKELSKGMSRVMKRVYTKDGVYSNYGYDDMYDEELIRAGAPVHDSGGNVIGGVLLNANYAKRVETVDNVEKTVFIALLSAWFVSMCISFLLSKQLSGPISKIGRTARILAEGAYETKTGVSVSGEIGELAETVDVLSDRLAENEKIRKEIDRSRMDFFANVSHELRTPITVMRGYTETLNDGIITDNDKIKNMYERMLNECKGMERLVGDLLTLSKMQNPDFMLNLEPVSLVQIFENAVKSARVLSEKKNITIRMEYNDEYCFMSGDYDRLRQMFLIILDNAIKFSHENSYIDIKLEKGEKLKASIKDYGIGIDEDMLPYIFEKFYKSKLQMNEKGSGLGLVIAKAIAARHNGKVEVYSKPGEGTRFTFTFDSIEPPM
ncbi:MAG: HAMP domain-containing sensor histidine kinase [Lachnospiraceae bacterium]|nr:HAMP domain-containing histidine kinase [Lachnoclostridium sp.]MDD7521019.1 HAMP domain-containing sensor histidine kinase [Lachnoclostridium sp.]MDY2599927.1 HAMP domain-containing sensor histidine kinase [Lachnospiraceae bacterium]